MHLEFVDGNDSDMSKEQNLGESSTSQGSVQSQDENEDLDEFDVAGSEFRSLNSVMDQLQRALDLLESRNDGIHEELLELLQSSRQMRREFTGREDLNNDGSGKVEEDERCDASSEKRNENCTNLSQDISTIDSKTKTSSEQIVDGAKLENLNIHEN